MHGNTANIILAKFDLTPLLIRSGQKGLYLSRLHFARLNTQGVGDLRRKQIDFFPYLGKVQSIIDTF